MKKFLILMLALVCALAMFACGDDPVIPGPDGGDKVPTELNIDEFVAAVNASSPKTAEIKVKMENALGTLNAEYDVVYTGDGAAAVNYTREVFNEIGAEEPKSTVTGIAAITKDGAIDSQALGATGSVVMTKLNLQLDKMTASKDGSVLTATVSAANTASVLGVDFGADVTLVLYIANGTVSSFSLNYIVGANTFKASCAYTY